MGKKINYKIFFIAILLLLPFTVLAIESGDDVIRILQNITNWLWRVFLIATVIAFLAAGFFYFTSAGNPDKVSRAHRMVLYGVIGVVVALLSAGMVSLIESFLET